MFQFMVIWPNGRGYTKVLLSMGAVIDEIGQVAQTDDEPSSINVTYLDPDVLDADAKVETGTFAGLFAGRKVRD